MRFFRRMHFFRRMICSQDLRRFCKEKWASNSFVHCVSSNFFVQRRLILFQLLIIFAPRKKIPALKCLLDFFWFILGEGHNCSFENTQQCIIVIPIIVMIWKDPTPFSYPSLYIPLEYMSSDRLRYPQFGSDRMPAAFQASQLAAPEAFFLCGNPQK